MPAKRPSRPAPVTPPDLAAALAGDPAARAAWDRQTPGCRREHLGYIDEAKRPETRARRIAQTVATLAGRAAAR